MSISDERPAILFRACGSRSSGTPPDAHSRPDQTVLRPKAHETFHALREISFSINRGESVAVIGPNGAGKSTLLNLTTNLCLPDQGSRRSERPHRRAARVGRRISPDLTGAENVRGQCRPCWGFRGGNVREKFHEIVAFSELERFIDEPLRTYSTGMMMRLAFSVAVSADPDILIIDEVLGVGDLSFSGQMPGTDYCNSGIPARRCCACRTRTITLMGLCDRAMCWIAAA